MLEIKQWQKWPIWDLWEYFWEPEHRTSLWVIFRIGLTTLEGGREAGLTPQTAGLTTDSSRSAQ